MAQIYYQINAGYPNFTAHIEPNVAPDQTHSSTGIYSFDDIPTGNYSITITDAIGCEAFFDNISITTTTTTTSPIVEVKYGILYNWYAATDVRNIANTGWHLPTQEDFNTLLFYLDPSISFPYEPNVAGGKLKEMGTTHWSSPNQDATNEYGFNGRGGGSRADNEDPLYAGTFDLLTFTYTMWTSTEENPLEARVCFLEWASGSFSCYNSDGKSMGYSIRLIKDSTTLLEGETSTYLGNDGKVYNTICIGTQEWLAESLSETRYGNGDIIPEVTDNLTWATLTSGALCAYNNDWNNV